MAKLEVLGFDDLDDAFKRIGNIPADVTASALDAMADEATDRIKRIGEQMGVRDPESNVHILDKITTKKPKVTDDGGYEVITFSGTRTRGKTKTRNAEIAFVNEYGKRGQSPRPFMKKAMADDKAIAAPGEDIVGDWIEKEFSKN